VSAGTRRFFSGATETLAVLEAAGHFGLLPAELAYRTVDKKHGFLRRPKVVIEVDPSSPGRQAEAPPSERPAPRPPAPTPPRAAPQAPPPPAPVPPTPRQPAPQPPPAVPPGEAVEAGAGLEGAVAAAQDVVALAGLRVEARAERTAVTDGDGLRVDLVGADAPLLLHRQGELLRACEHLVRRMVLDPPPGGIDLDSGGFRAERESALRRRAAAAAEEVRRGGAPVLFEPLPPADRRILHLAVEAERGVASESQGEGEQRSVRVFARPGGSDPG
jgi:spoIIIJ-associated protein